MMKCNSDGCKRNAVFGKDGDTVFYCKEHKSDDMEDLINPKCKELNCKKQPTYGLKGEEARFCLTHKKPGMIDLKHKLCAHDGCNTRPVFGNSSDMTAVYCKNHKETDMIDVTAKHCLHNGCTSRPVFGTPGTKTVLYCLEHKTDDMVDLQNRSKICRTEGCQTRASFGIKGTKTPIFCGKHKTDDLVDVISKRCQFTGCDVRPTFGVKGTKTTLFCIKHKEEHHVDLVNKVCEEPGCTSIPTFGENNVKRFCKEHKKDMKDTRHVLCKQGCGLRANFGLPKGKAEYCKSHKTSDMINLNRKLCKFEGCLHLHVFGYPGKPRQFCHEHRQVGMIRDPSRKCIESGCKSIAIFGMRIHEHCEKHKVEGEINIVEKKCNACGLLGLTDANGNCETCDPSTFKRVRLAKQNAVRDFLLAQGIPFTTVDRIINDGECGLERPDFYIDCGTHILIIEVDEHQHAGRPCECEQTRMVNVSQSNGMPTMFLRYNPDKYKTKKGVEMHSTTQRMNTLLEWTRYWMKTKPESFLSVMYLYFDGYEYGKEKSDVILNYE